jgi:hypothetical protein
VFAAGDVREGSVKRVASAVGEGAATIPQIHRYLQTTAAAPAAAPVTPLTGQHSHDGDPVSALVTAPTPTGHNVIGGP